LPKCFLGLSPTGLVRVSFPFDSVTHSQLKRIRPSGVWLGSQDGWEFPFESISPLKEELGSRFVITDELARWIRLRSSREESLMSIKDIIKDVEIGHYLEDGRELFPHQISGVSWLLSKRKAILADEMGLGKTLTALLAAKTLSKFLKINIMVIAPIGLHSFWQKEAKILGINIELKSWSAIPKEFIAGRNLLIVDEAHFAQSIHTKRTKSLLRLSRHPFLTFIWLLSGTPIRNGRASELFPLLAAIDHPLGRNYLKFKSKFCESHMHYASFHLKSDLESLKSLNELRVAVAPYMLTRTKDTVLQLPPKIRKVYEVKLPFNENKGFTYRVELAIDNYRQRVDRGFVRAETESLVLLGALRQISAEFKLPFVRTFLEELFVQNKSVVLFSSFLKPLILLRQYVQGELLTGAQSLKEREEIIDSFQGGHCKLLLATYGAAGVGYTLHKAKHVVLLDRPWTPGEVKQAEDRCHRLGMDGPLTSHWFKLGFADQLVDGLLTGKEEKISILIGHKSTFIKRQSLNKMIHFCLDEYRSCYH
tara:strand:- start:911 stop:2515 length:1605 start_codon:yes stop_codon:yes gene_type:complete